MRVTRPPKVSLRQEYPMATTYLTDGGYVVTSEPAGTNELHIQKYSSNGTPVGGDFVVNGFFSFAPDHVQVVALSNAGYAVGFNIFTGAHFGEPANGLAVFNSAGQEVNSIYTSGLSAPTLIASPLGGFIFAGGGSNDVAVFNPGIYAGQLLLSDNTGHVLSARIA